MSDNALKPSNAPAVPQGYKQTEVGVIPEDWEVKFIGDCLKIRHGKSQHEVVSETGEYPILATGGQIGRASRPLYAKPSVLIGRKGTIDLPRYMATPFWSVDTLFYSEIATNSDAKFLYYKFCMVDWYSYNEASGVPSLNARTIEKVQVAIPPHKLEQQAIAEALSDADALIEGLESLIAKKQQVKQGAMLELLAPNDEWEERILNDVCSPSKERFTPLDDSQEKRCIELEHISSNDGRLLGFTSTKGIKSQKAVFERGDVLFGKLRPYLRKYLLADFSGVCSTELWVLKARPDISSEWLYWLVQTDSVIDAANKSTGTKMPRAEWRTVKETAVSVPSFDEQKRIAAILSDIDAEIASLETKLSKARRVKAGMMQDLLTGKVRLV